MSSQVKELELGDYVNLVGRRWRWIVGTVVVGLALVAAFTFTRDEVYQSRTDLIVLTPNSTGQFAFEPRVEERLVRSSLVELQLMAGQVYLRDAEAQLGYEPNITFNLIDSANPRDPSDSSVIRMTARESSAARAQASAQAFADNYVARRTADDLRDITEGRDLAGQLRTDLEEQRLELRRPILELQAERAASLDPAVIEELTIQIDRLENDSRASVQAISQQIGVVNANIVELDQAINSLDRGNSATRVINDAFLPQAPVSPNVPRNLMLGTVVALLLGLLLATLRELLDTSAGDATELATLADTPIIASVPLLARDRSQPGGVRRFASLTNDQASPYRVLLDSVWLSGNGTRIKTVAVTSVKSGLGSTQTAVNMAQAEARRGAAVCLVDADFDDPELLERLGLDDSGPGLADILSDRCTLNDAITPTDVTELDVLGAGLVDQWASNYLRSNRLSEVLGALSSRYELIIVDTASISGLAEARTVASQCDGVVVVYDEAVSKRDDVVNAVGVLRSAHARPLGLVSNRSTVRQQIHIGES